MLIFIVIFWVFTVYYAYIQGQIDGYKDAYKGIEKQDLEDHKARMGEIGFQTKNRAEAMVRRYKYKQDTINDLKNK